MFVRLLVPWHPDRSVSATSPSSLRENQNLCNNCVTVQWRRAGRRASPYRHPSNTRMSFPRVEVPLPFRNARIYDTPMRSSPHHVPARETMVYAGASEVSLNRAPSTDSRPQHELTRGSTQALASQREEEVTTNRNPSNWHFLPISGKKRAHKRKLFGPVATQARCLPLVANCLQTDSIISELFTGFQIQTLIISELITGLQIRTWKLFP